MVTGIPKVLLRIEGLAVLAASVWFYARSGASWVLFAVLILVPDVSALGYLLGKRVGAAVYDVAHLEVWPLALIVYGVAQDVTSASSLGLIWLAHIGMDRAAGFGFKYPTGFGDTHLGKMGST